MGESEEPHRNSRLIFNIGGQRHETFVSTLKAIPNTRLSWIADNYLILKHSPAYDPAKNEFFFDRNPACFSAIVNYFRTGQLHYPTDICGPMFQVELKFWGVDEAQMESCCWEGYTANRDKDAKLKGFKGPDFENCEEQDYRDDLPKSKRWQLKVWTFLDNAHSSRAAKIYSYFGYLVLFIYIFLPILSSMDVIKNGTDRQRLIIKISEVCLNVFFSIELFIKVLLCPDKKEFLRDKMNFVDFMSLIPIYLKLAISENKVTNYTDILAVFRIVKVFRSFRYNYTLQVLVNTLKESLPELGLLVFLMLILATVFAYASYFMERKMEGTRFQSIPHCLWWAFITMTTVGYGDMYPHSWLGQIIGIMCAISGLLMVALPVSVVATNFSIYYSYAKARISLPPKMKVKLATDANNFLGQADIKEEEKRKRKSRGKITPISNGTNGTLAPPSNGITRKMSTNGRRNSGTLNGAPVGPRGNTLPPLRGKGNNIRFKEVIQKMRDKGMIKPKNKMDFSTLVMVLSSKGDWSSPT